MIFFCLLKQNWHSTPMLGVQFDRAYGVVEDGKHFLIECPMFNECISIILRNHLFREEYFV